MSKTTTYIDLGEGYFQVYPTSVGEFKKDLTRGEMFRRYSFGQFTFRNEPKKYAETSSDCYQLYDLIKAMAFDAPIYIKHVYGTTEIIGIFYSYMCEYEDDDEHNVLKVTPIVYDQYTELYENWEKEIDVISGGGKNKIKNGNFGTWEDSNTPLNWTIDRCAPEIYYKFDKIMCKIPGVELTVSNIRQSLYVIPNQLIQLSFNYAIYHLVTTESIPSCRSVEVKLVTNTNTYYLQSDRTWTTVASKIYYTPTGLISLQVDYFTKMKYFTITSETVPDEGTLTISFLVSHDLYPVPPETVYLVLSDIKLYASTVARETITINYKSDYLRTLEILSYLSCAPTEADYQNWSITHPTKHHLYQYFSPSDEPNLDTLADEGLGFRQRSGDMFTIPQLIEALQDQENKYGFYLGELSEMTVYQGDTFREAWIFSAWKQRLYATCKFSREVAYTEDDDEGNPVPPQADAGWVDMGIVPNGRRWWIRKPYNGSVTEWEYYKDVEGDNALPAYDGTPLIQDDPYIVAINGGATLYESTERYYLRLSARKVYVNESTKDFDAIDLKDVFKIFFNSLHPVYADKEVYSTFFWNDNENLLSTLTNRPGTNYVTYEENFLNHVACLHTTDFKTENYDSNTDPVLNMSFKSFLEDIKAYFNIYNYGGIYWWIDDDYNFHIEHASYLEMLGTTENVTEYLVQPMKNFKYLIEELNNTVVFNQVNSGYPDFYKNKMTFEKMVMKLNEDKTRENNTKYLTTDLRFCIDNANSLSNGLILVHHDHEGNVIESHCPVSETSMLNGKLALSNLLNKFCRYEGMWLFGEINDEQVSFRKILRIKEGNEIILKGIIDWDFFSTPIDRNGLVKSLTHNFEEEITRATLIYRRNFALMVQKDNNFVGAKNIYLQIGYY